MVTVATARGFPADLGKVVVVIGSLFAAAVAAGVAHCRCLSLLLFCRLLSTLDVVVGVKLTNGARSSCLLLCYYCTSDAKPSSTDRTSTDGAGMLVGCKQHKVSVMIMPIDGMVLFTVRCRSFLPAKQRVGDAGLVFSVF